MGFSQDDIINVGEKENKNEYMKKLLKEETKKEKKLPNKYVGSVGFNMLAAKREDLIKHGFKYSPSSKKYPTVLESSPGGFLDKSPGTKKDEQYDPFNPFADPPREAQYESPSKIEKATKINSISTPQNTNGKKDAQSPSTPFDTPDVGEEINGTLDQVKRPAIFTREDQPEREKMKKLSKIVAQEYNDLFNDENLVQLQEVGTKRQNFYSGMNDDIKLDDNENLSDGISLDMEEVSLALENDEKKVDTPQLPPKPEVQTESAPEKVKKEGEDWRVTAAKQQQAFNPFIASGYEMSVTSNDQESQLKNEGNNVESTLKMN